MPKVGLDDIQRARKRIAPYISQTPLRPWDYLRRSLSHEAPLYLKLDNLQNTGSFKVRGGANKILELVEQGQRPSQVVAASAGNHAQAVAFISGKLGIPSTIVMPEGAPLVKAAATQDYGAEVVLHGSLYDEAFNKAQELLAKRPGAVYVHAYEDPAIIAGQGTMGLEIDEQLTAAGHGREEALQVVVPIGGGGLISGVATALKALRPNTKVYGVVCEAAPAIAESFARGEIVASRPGRSRTLAEGLAVKKVSPMTFEYIRALCQDVAIVGDDEVADAIARLMERGKLVTEGAGAAGVAALLSAKIRLDPKIPTVVVLCGGNIDMNAVSNILERGLSRSGRWLKLGILVEDRPGELAKVAVRIGELRGNILEVVHDRTSASCPVGFTKIRFQLETRGLGHAQEIQSSLEAQGYVVEKTS